ncbi:serine/threonine protein kinase [Gemmata sp. JC673]|uniref:Serine/threonine protein kinase n=1 Tax=Gemmata algarum TaxID=2975278 RepID=A0ABU5F683_9BACT|nr:serine/threonine-protein kinase [Gemmata algarum]MDY3562262.1 serine/threonine protein kinase [Gemmata algarum]
MDSVIAARMRDELVGREVGGWRAVELLGAGKSALVLKAERDGQTAALKVFDPELIKKYGEERQLGRIERERRLIGLTHPHLVRIFDGGKCGSTNHLYVVMECVPAKDLSQLLPAVPRDKIRPLIAQLALAARFLHEQELAHRDIKPSNIAVSDDFERLTLLDLGVLRPFGEVGLTDVEGQHFVGTLQYSSPEFLFRNEEDTPEGWLALAFYQIGAVLHDLLTKRTIFEDFVTPYARMVDAVKHTPPDLNVPGADPDLVALAQSCLVKDPHTRLRLVSWEKFAAAPPPVTVATIKDRVKKRQVSAAAPVTQSAVAASLALNELLGPLTSMIRGECLSNVDVFPQVEVHDHPLSEAEAVAFRAAFPKAPAKGLNSCFALLFVIRMVDAAASIVEVTVAGAVSNDVRRFPADAFSDPKVFYLGPSENEKLKTQVEYVLYAAVEAAMVTPVAGDEDAAPMAVEIPDGVE